MEVTPEDPSRSCDTVVRHVSLDTVCTVSSDTVIRNVVGSVGSNGQKYS